MLAPGFYARKDYRTPMIGSVASVILHLLITVVFVFVLEWGAFSIAIATSAAAWFNCIFLSHRLSRSMGEPLLNPEVLFSFIKVGACAIIAAGATLTVGHFLIGDATLRIVAGERDPVFVREFQQQFLQFLTMGGTFVLIFLSYAWMMQVEKEAARPPIA